MANYVKNSDLLKQILISRENGKLTDEAVVMLQRMVKECSRIFRYRDIEDKEDCMAFATMDVLQYWNRFNPEKSSNAFSYFTQIIKNGYAKAAKKIWPIKQVNKISISQTNGVYNI